MVEEDGLSNGGLFFFTRFFFRAFCGGGLLGLFSLLGLLSFLGLLSLLSGTFAFVGGDLLELSLLCLRRLACFFLLAFGGGLLAFAFGGGLLGFGSRSCSRDRVSDVTVLCRRDCRRGLVHWEQVDFQSRHGEIAQTDGRLDPSGFANDINLGACFW